MKTPLLKWMQEVTALLCYQSDIPQQHKIDLANALEAYEQSIGPVATDDQNVRDQKHEC
jgi:hypothetical protein